MLEGFNLENETFEVQIRKSEPEGPLSSQDLASNEDSFVVHDGTFLWRVSISKESPEAQPSLTERLANSRWKTVPDAEFRYDEHGLPAIVYAQITGVIVANL